jgi:hypothetical protein
MIARKIFFILSVLILAGLLWPAGSVAQTPPQQVVVIYPATEAQADSLALNVFFTLTDAEGRPVTQANIESASIQLVGSESAPIPATVTDPKTPFYIVLLLDASGSMADVMPAVREAAKTAMDGAPALAQVSVIQFDEKSRRLSEFTSNHDRVKSDIDRVEATPGSSTCLYDSLYDTIDLLEKQVTGPQERRAIIVFTDGKDEKREGGVCSFYAYEDVIKRARPINAPNTPIHTIGLCDTPQCANINRAELRNLALDTTAFAAVGQANDLGNLFREIMDGLRSQWVAQANVYPIQGENQAVLSVKLNDQPTPLATTFKFLSGRTYTAPLAPVEARITSLTYDKEADLYRLALSLTSPQAVSQVIVQVWDTKSGTQILPDQVQENPGPTLQFERNTAGFEPGREYAFRVKALDKKNGVLIENDKGEDTLSQQIVTYEPIQAEVVLFTVESVNPDLASGKLIIDLNVPDEGRVYQYDGFIIDEAGQKVAEFNPTLYPGKRIEETLPPAIRQAAAPGSYKITIALTTKDEQRFASDPYEFKFTPPPPPGLLTQVLTVLQTPVVWGTILIIILCVVALIFYWSRPAKAEPLPQPKPRPPVEQSVDLPSLRFKVLQMPNLNQPIEKVITDFPCVVGRVGADLTLSTDESISRRHLEISLRGGEFFITDLKSTYGTFIGEAQLEANKPTRLTGSTVIRLGRRTHIRLEPQ